MLRLQVPHFHTLHKKCMFYWFQVAAADTQLQIKNEKLETVTSLWAVD